MKFVTLIKEMNSDIKDQQKQFATQMGGIQNFRHIPTVEQVEVDTIKSILNHAYRPNEYSVGLNGSIIDVSVGDNNITGPFNKVIQSCIEIVTKQ